MQEIDFVSTCPIKGCKNGQRAFKWIHYDCGGCEKINQYAQIRCVKCGEKGNFINWKFDCKRHEYDEDSCQSKNIALDLGSKLLSNDQVLLSKIVGAITLQFANGNYNTNEQNDDVVMKDDTGGDEFNNQQQQRAVVDVHTSGNTNGKRSLEQQQQQQQQCRSEMDLVCKCPETQCQIKRNNKDIKWKHNKCSGTLKISNDGIVKCEKCKKKQKLLYCKFKCSNSAVYFDERKSLETLSYYLLIASGLKPNDPMFVSKLTKNIMEEYNKCSK